MSRQRSHHFDAIIRQLDEPTSNVRKMVDYLLGDRWHSIDVPTANALMYSFRAFEKFFQDYISRPQFVTQDNYGGVRGRLHDLLDGATAEEIEVWLKKRGNTFKLHALAIFSCRIILITWMLETGDTEQLNDFTRDALCLLSRLMKEFLRGYKCCKKQHFHAKEEWPDITPKYLTDLFKPIVSGPLPPYMESRARQVSAYAADGRRTQMVGYIGRIGVIFGCECLPSYSYKYL